MMRAAALALLLVVPTDAHRVKLDTNVGTIRSEMFDSCDDLQNMFNTRVQNIQALQEAHPDSSSMTATTHARFTMRAFGVVRILRRARDCRWVTEDNNADEIEKVQSVANSALAGNPCGDAAMEALAAPASPENELQPLQDAVQILLSDNCEAPEDSVQNEVIDPEDETSLSEQLIDGEERAQDQIDEIMDAVTAENGAQAGAFVQTEGIIRSVSRMLGVVFLTIFYLLSCAATGVVIGGLLLSVVGMIPCLYLVTGSAALGCFMWPIIGVGMGAAAGLVNCGINAASQGNSSQLGRGSF